MPFTFAHHLDPMVRAPAIQRTIVGALITCGFVKPAKDDSHGAIWAALQDWNWVTHSHQPSGMIFLRRFALRSSRHNHLGVLWIGAQLDGVDYRISCDGLQPEERARMGRLLAFAGLAIGRCSLDSDGLGFKARSIRLSRWAGRSPDGARSDISGRQGAWDDGDAESDAPPAPMGGGFYQTNHGPQAQDTYLHHDEVVADESEIYSNAD